MSCTLSLIITTNHSNSRHSITIFYFSFSFPFFSICYKYIICKIYISVHYCNYKAIAHYWQQMIYKYCTLGKDGWTSLSTDQFDYTQKFVMVNSTIIYSIWIWTHERLLSVHGKLFICSIRKLCYCWCCYYYCLLLACLPFAWNFYLLMINLLVDIINFNLYP